ncbi:MAG: hypothetical protein KBS65_00220, partial [Prevotella sp.]|nr:hypothetical protein [Candidatus Equicola stercoris]
MRKILSLICALVFIVLGTNVAFAQNVTKANIVKKSPVAVEQMKKAQLMEGAVKQKDFNLLNLKELKPTPLKNANNLQKLNKKAGAKAPMVKRQSMVKANHQAAPVKKTVATVAAPKKTGETINVTAVDWYYDNSYYDVYLQSEDNVYLFELLESTGGLTYGKTYTYADMYADWVCTLDEEGYPLVKATDATLTVTKDQDGLIHVAATMVLDGDTHNITYDEKPFVPTGVKINVNATNYKSQYVSYYGEYAYTASNEDFNIAIWVYTDTELGTFTDEVDVESSYLQEAGGGQYVIFHSLATPIVVAQDEAGNKSLTGSFYAENGDEYILNLVYEKPDAKEINIHVENATLNNKTAAGFWTISGQTEDKNNDFMIYFISKGLQGIFTDVEKFNAYSTWVSDKSTGSNVYYENLSAVNLTSKVVEDSLVIEGTLSLADSNGNPANVT